MSGCRKSLVINLVDRDVTGMWKGGPIYIPFWLIFSRLSERQEGLVGGLGRVGNDEMLRQYLNGSSGRRWACLSEDLRAKMLPMLGVSGFDSGRSI
jgi:hypothetical protein